MRRGESKLIQNRGHPSGAANQGQALRAEGVTVNVSNMGELMVDLAEFGVSIIVPFCLGDRFASAGPAYNSFVILFYLTI